MDDEQTIPGHECNAYCKPEEELHCEVVHMWRDAALYPEAEWYERLNREVEQGVWAYKSYDIAHFEPAKEAPPLPEDEYRPYLRTVGRFSDFWAEHTVKHFSYQGPHLLWFRVPVEVKA